VYTNVEILNEVRGHFDKLWILHLFTDHVRSLIWDEGTASVLGAVSESIQMWSGSTTLYPHTFYITSATLPSPILRYVRDLLQMRDDAYLFHCSNDRPNIHLTVCELKYSQSSFQDFAFLIPKNVPLKNLPIKFLVFFDSIADSIEAAKYL